MIHVDTSFIVDLVRDASRGAPGPARKLLEELADQELWVSVHSLCELFAGAELSRPPAAERAKVVTLVHGFQVALPNERFAPTYGRLLAWLERRGHRVTAMDLVIATAAVVDQAPVVTRNGRDSARVAGLELLEY